MPIDFFASPCVNLTGNCSTSILCCTPLSFDRFGISDANSNSRSPAFIVTTSPTTWDFTIENPHNRMIQYKAIDYCISIYRTGTYDVKNDESDIANFSSDDQGTQLIKRCEGFLFEENRWILFFEIKTKLNQGWLIDARRKFEETILSFKEHHPHLAHQLYVTNMGTNEVAIIDPKTKKVVKKFASGGESPINVAIDEVGRRLFVTNSSTGLTILHADSGELLKVVKFKGGSLGVKYAPTANKIVLANRESGKTVVVDGKSYEVVTELETGSHPNTVAVNVKTGTAYVTNKTKRMPKEEGKEPQVDTNGDIVSKIQL